MASSVTEQRARWRLHSGSPDHPPTDATATLREIPSGVRVQRAATALLAGVVVALLVIPIPLVHLVGIPLALGGGVVAAIRLLRVPTLLRGVHGSCPRCGQEQDFFTGLGYFGFQLPLVLSCGKCGRDIRAEAA